MLRLIFCTAGVFISGCSATVIPLYYSKSGGTEQAFLEDRYQCIQQAQQARTAGYANQYGAATDGRIVTSRPIFTSCMTARGYAISPTAGTWTAPPGGMVIMVD